MKKHILLPVVLLVYLAFMAYFTYPARSVTGGISYTSYYVTIGVTFVIIIFLAYFLKRQEDNRKKRKEKEKK
jgi:uncharacterized membrane protein